ncbi:MAG: hypothetical protein Tsb0014_38300 [Pleurocapsa sp.]
MFKTRSRENFIFGNRQRKRRRRFMGVWAIASVVLSLLVLELLIRIFMDLSGQKTELAQANIEPDIASAYTLKFVNESLEPYKTFENKGTLIAKRSLAVGYQLVGQQNSEYWQIEAQGFRDRDTVPLAKPKDEVRIFLLGGSTAFGYGNFSNNDTISEQLEVRLQQRIQQQKTSPQFYKPDVLPLDEEERKKALAKPSKIKPGQYRVINGAVPGYASGNEMAQFALQVLKFKPDVVIILDGYADLMLPSQDKAVQIPQLEAYLNDAPSYFRAYISQLVEPLESKSYLAKAVQNRWLNPENSQQKVDFLLKERLTNLAQHLPTDEAELQKRVERYLQHHQQILSLCAGSHIPLIVATQPEITGRNPSKLTPTEGEIATTLGRQYIKKVKETYPSFVEANQKLAQSFPHNMKALNLYNLSDKYPSPSFIDAVHLNETANEQVAEQLYYAIATFPKMQIAPKNPSKPKPQANFYRSF